MARCECSERLRLHRPKLQRASGDSNGSFLSSYLSYTSYTRLCIQNIMIKALKYLRFRAINSVLRKLKPAKRFSHMYKTSMTWHSRFRKGTIVITSNPFPLILISTDFCKRTWCYSFFQVSYTKTDRFPDKWHQMELYQISHCQRRTNQTLRLIDTTFGYRVGHQKSTFQHTNTNRNDSWGPLIT